MHIEHAALGLSLDLPELKQRDVEAWYKAMRAYDPDWRNLPLSEIAGAYVRAAAACGWLPGIAASAVGDLSPAKVRWLAVRIDAHVGEAVAIPLDSASPSPTTPTG